MARTPKSGPMHKPLFGHPDAQKVLAIALDSLITESDRGAVIIGLDLIDAQLTFLLRTVFPSSHTKDERTHLLQSHGALSSVANKAAIAFAMRLIDRNLFDAITAARKLRNTVAHSSQRFRLAHHEPELGRIVALGPGVPQSVNRLAGQSLVRLAVQSIRNVKVMHDQKEVVPIATDQSAIDWLHAHKDVLGTLEERRHRVELGIGVGMICALLIHHRERIAARFSDDSLIGEARPSRGRRDRS